MGGVFRVEAHRVTNRERPPALEHPTEHAGISPRFILPRSGGETGSGVRTSRWLASGAPAERAANRSGEDTVVSAAMLDVQG